MSENNFELQVGMCDIFVEGNAEFPVQGEAAEFLAEPIYEDIDLYEISNYDKLLVGWNVTFKIVLEDYSKKALELGMPMLEPTDFGHGDAKLMSRARDKAKEIRIHPRDRADTDREHDIVIYKAFPVNSFEKKFGKEKSTWEIQFVALAKDADPKAVNNYFSIGQSLLG